MSAINYHISQTDWIKYTKTMSASVKISRVCAKVIPIKMFFRTWHFQRATLSLAICVFSAVTFVFIFFFVGFSGGFRAS